MAVGIVSLFQHLLSVELLSLFELLSSFQFPVIVSFLSPYNLLGLGK
jgi:hypothetical protein